MKLAWWGGLIAAAILTAACGGGDAPIPYMVDQNYEMQSGCVQDFSAEEGRCIGVVEGEVSPFCAKNEPTCVEHIYFRTQRGRPHVTHINVRYPCYPDWMYARYSDPDSKWFRNGRYEAVSLELANDVINNRIHLIEILADSKLQTDSMCYYRIEGAIADLEDGAYDLELWDPERELILHTTIDR